MTMERLRKGYKQTELGAIPEDWEVIPLANHFHITSSKRVFQSQWRISGVPFYRARELAVLSEKGYVDNELFIDESLYNDFVQLYGKPNDGDILITGVGTLGKLYVVKSDDKFYFKDGNIIWLKSSSTACSQFVKYSFQTPNVINQVHSGATGTTVGTYTITNAKNTMVGFPPTIKEQRAIAYILNDIDSLLEALDKKIAKKRAIKEGAMQQLLIGKKRLKGFTKPWVEKNFEEILGKQIRKGQILTASDYVGGVIPVIAGGKTPAGYHAYYNRDRNTITISASGANAGFIAFYRDPIFATDCSTINESTKYDIKFIFFLLCLYQDVIYKAQTGGAQPHIHAKDIYPLEVLYTTNTKEQQAIAQILTDMDDEIRQLENERQKYTALKQGAMQQLLTGQIRLTNAEQSQRQSKIRTIPVHAHVIGGHIVNTLYGSRGWGRTKLQKSMHLIGYCCQLDFGNEYVRNVAGPDDQTLMNHLDAKFKQYRHVRIERTRNDRGGRQYNYIPTPMIAEAEQVFENYPTETKSAINNLLNKIKAMDLARAEIVSTLYAVWNNRIIKGQLVDDNLLLADFYDWSEHKADFSQDLVLRALGYMRREGIVPIGWGKYIDKK